MYSRPIVKQDFNVPQELVTESFILRPLTIKYLRNDYEAVMDSQKHLHKLMDDSDWPIGMTLDENLVDLGWHEKEFSLKHSFAYTVVMPNNEDVVIGCCYISVSYTHLTLPTNREV